MPPLLRNILALITFWSISLFGQSLESDAINTYKENFKWQPNEIYVHLNKMVFIPGEVIYFTAYVFDRSELAPLKGKMNLDVGLYDDKGKQLKGSIWEIENGIVHGSLQTDRNFAQGRYYFKGSTNWNKNFSDRGNFILELNLIENELENKRNTNENVRIRFVTEGGNLLNDQVNTLGFQIIDGQNKGVSLRKGQIEDSKGKIVFSGVKSNSFGLGRIDLFIEKKKSYFYRFELSNGHVDYGILPSAKDEGYSLNISGPVDQSRIVTVQCGTNNFKVSRNKRFYLIIHQGNSIKSIPFKMNEEKKSFKMDRSYLSPGVNTVSLFDKEFNLLNQRVFFNHHKLRKGEAQVVLKKIGKDSIHVGIRSRSLLDANGSFSVSVLPDNNQLNRERKTGFDVLYLRPFLDEYAEISPVYYKSFDRKALYYLDLLFMIHGKADYTWSKKAEVISSPEFPEETGFTIKGKLKRKMKKNSYSLAFFQERIDLMNIIEVKKDSTFSLQNFPVYEELPINFVLIDSKGKMQEPMLEMEIYPKKKRDSIELSERGGVPYELKKENEEQSKFMQAFDEQSNVLDTVTLVAKRTETETTRNTRLNTGFWNAMKISEEESNRHQLLSRYIRSLGFRVRSFAINNTFFVDARSNSPQVRPPTIYLDGFPLTEPLRDELLHTIDEIYYEHTGLTRSNGGSIYIYRKYNSRVAEGSAPFISREADTGFQRPAPFISLIDPDGMDDRIKQYLSVYWEPGLTSNQESEIIFSFPKLGMKDFIFYIEGVTFDGWIFSETVTIEDFNFRTEKH